jgi:hypothetical protein
VVAGFGSSGGFPGTPAPRTTKVQIVPAPTAGIDSVSPLVATEPSYGLSLVNLVPSGPGLRVRSGYTSFATVTGTGGARTIIPFEGSTTQKLFAVTSAAIFDISAGGAGVSSVALPSAAGAAGWGTWTDFVSDANTHYAFYADEQNGLYRYQEAGAWAAVTDITGVAETDLVFTTQHQGRMWFVERSTANAWYLAAGAISGAATVFHFGNKFRHGGTLIGLYPWTVDGGEGLNDHLVAISSGGDVMVYKGIDPSSASTWELVGQWYVGALPAGRRIAQNEGGDLYILSQYGVIPLTRLMQGSLVQQDTAQLSRNISPLIATAMALTRSSRGWEMRNVPSENVFLVSRPALTGYNDQQFTLSTHTNGWSVFESLPYQTGDTWVGSFYFGDSSGNVWLLTGNADNGIAISFSLLSSFQEYGEIGLYHRAQFIRPVFRSVAAPSYAIEARYDYDDSPVLTSSLTPVLSGSLWDAAVWDTDMWASSGTVVQATRGASGLGRAMAVAMTGYAASETLFIRADLFFDTAGPL